MFDLLLPEIERVATSRASNYNNAIRLLNESLIYLNSLKVMYVNFESTNDTQNDPYLNKLIAAIKEEIGDEEAEAVESQKEEG